jgi:putative transposase
MSRQARLVVPGYAHLITQRGTGGLRLFYSENDYATYLELLKQSCATNKVRCLGYVLTPKLLHLILIPQDVDGLRRALAPVHQIYAGKILARQKRDGLFWKGRFGAVVMQEAYFVTALQYILNLPVRARLADKPEDWVWSSAKAYLKGRDDGLTEAAPVLDTYPNARSLLRTEPDADMLNRILAAETTSRPCGDTMFVKKLERKTGRVLAPAKRGPKV